MVSDKRTAIITGGASGIGLAVAHALAKVGGWDITIVGRNASAGAAAAEAITKQSCSTSPSNPSSATFQRADCVEYAELASAFEATFARAGRLDFVFANAGIVGGGNFYAAHDTGSAPPPPPDLLVSKICLDGVYTTTYLAQHYFRQTPKSALVQGSSDQSLVMTASVGGLYPRGRVPLYAAAKHGIVGFMRSIAPSFYRDDEVRVNAICPGPVKTGIDAGDQFKGFDQGLLTAVDEVAAVVLMLIEGKDSVPMAETRIDGVRAVDGGGKDQDALLWGNAVEISTHRHYYRDPPGYSDAAIETNMTQ
ncbi:15-hydroxyprostaglandin dehydrogenase (NAD) [Microdochium nivale]|nr:15-hydroxyprostaglandin dehydrogenase (NAD) [Microdochium nivale]